MKTVIIVANDDEANHLKDLVFNHTPGKPVSILITGEGRSNVIRTIAEKLINGYIEFDDRIINVGYVGAYGFKKGDIVCINEVQHLIPSKTIKELPIKFNLLTKFQPAECFTSDNFVDADDIDPWMPEKFVCDMELYYIALMFPNVISYKIVSDTLNYDEYKEENFDKSWKMVKEYIKENL